MLGNDELDPFDGCLLVTDRDGAIKSVGPTN